LENPTVAAHTLKAGPHPTDIGQYADNHSEERSDPHEANKASIERTRRGEASSSGVVIDEVEAGEPVLFFTLSFERCRRGDGQNKHLIGASGGGASKDGLNTHGDTKGAKEGFETAGSLGVILKEDNVAIRHRDEMANRIAHA